MADILTLFAISMIAGLATGVGGIIASVSNPSKRACGFLIGSASGVMIAISFLSLIGKAWQQGGYVTATFGFLVGSLLMLVIDMSLPHIHFAIKENIKNFKHYKTGVLIAIGIALHNIPEGLAEGVGYSFMPRLGLLIAAAIALHNIPEGIATAIPLRLGGASKFDAIKISFLSGAVEPVGAVLAALFLSGFQSLVPFMLAFAGGVMIFITMDELVPMAQRQGHEHFTALGIISGFAAMFVLIGAMGF